MTRPRPIDPESYAARLETDLPPDELRRRVAELIRAAVIASRGAVQVYRACGHCGRLMRLGGRSWDSRSDGAITRRYCSGKCRMARTRRL